MSEDFNKEAEREKLREKYEHDKEKREATEQMSELLLQGATMTNAHCSQCGDPIFRYEGQEFCPTCEKPVDRDDSAEGEDEDSDDDSIQVTTPSDDARVSFGQGDDEEVVENGAETPEGSVEERAQAQQNQPQQQRQRQTQPRQPAPSADVQTGGEAGTAAARETLVQTLTRFSQQAAAADDPARAQEHLAAAREAAEALAALRR